MAQKLIKKTVRLTPEVANLVDAQPKKSVFLRRAVEKAVAPKENATRIRITITFANTNYFTDKELTIVTSAVGNLKEKIIPLLDAVQQIQDVITFLDP